MGRKIAKALGGGREERGAIKVGSSDTVTWAIGHLLEDCLPHEYDERYRKWTLEDLPIIPGRFKRKPQDGKQAQLKVVSDLVRQATEVVVATDAGREGEAIAWTLLDHVGWKQGAQRLWTSSLGDDHLKKAVRQLIDDAEKKALYVAAKLRSAMDWCDGINLSRAYNLRLTNYGDKVLSLGRVQTATLAILVDRDLEIENFKPQGYFEFKALLSTAAGQLELMHRPPEAARVTDQAQAQTIASKTQGLNASLKVETKPVTMRPPPPFSLPELQMAASARWGWSAKRTLDELQKLYEAGHVTYPRTDSGYLTTDLKAAMPAHLAALQKHPDFRDLAKFKPLLRSSVFDDSKVEDHHGIIPTDQPCDPRKLDSNGARLYDIIARRFLAALMPDAKGQRTTITADLAGYKFKASGTIMEEMGWKVVWGKDGDPTEKKKGKDGEDDEDKHLPPVINGDPARSDKVDVVSCTTRPPPHYTEGTLLKAMLNAGSKNQDAEIRDLLSNGGLGTQATRQEIIEKLKFRDFARPEGKKIISTTRAREFVAILREEGSRLVDVVATADLERRLRQVEKDPSKMPSIWREYAQRLEEEIAILKKTPPRRKLSPCPRAARVPSPSSPRKGGKSPSARKRTSSKGKATGTGRSRAPAKPRKSAN